MVAPSLDGVQNVLSAYIDKGRLAQAVNDEALALVRQFKNDGVKLDPNSVGEDACRALTLAYGGSWWTKKPGSCSHFQCAACRS